MIAKILLLTYFSGGYNMLTCDFDYTRAKVHNPPILFDLNTDPEERNPLDLADPLFGTLAQHMGDLLAGIKNDIADDFKSVFDERQSESAFPCCNTNHTHCRC